MILVTVGTQLPFPRLLAAMDALAPSLDGEEVIAQAGPDPAPRPNLDLRSHLPAAAFDRLAAVARLIVGHAGIGTVLTAAAHGRPLIVMPRRAALGEHRNEHQLATAKRLEGRPGLAVAWTEADVPPLVATPPAAQSGAAAAPSRAPLIARIRGALDGS